MWFNLCIKLKLLKVIDLVLKRFLPCGLVLFDPEENHGIQNSVFARKM